MSESLGLLYVLDWWLLNTDHYVYICMRKYLGLHNDRLIQVTIKQAPLYTLILYYKTLTSKFLLNEA